MYFYHTKNWGAHLSSLDTIKLSLKVYIHRKMEKFLEIGFEIRKSLIVSKLLKSAPQFFVW